MSERCPKCNSSAPHMHPAVQCEGEVEICTDDFHLTPTNQNTQRYIDGVISKREAERLRAREALGSAETDADSK